MRAGHSGWSAPRGPLPLACPPHVPGRGTSAHTGWTPAGLLTLVGVGGACYEWEENHQPPVTRNSHPHLPTIFRGCGLPEGETPWTVEACGLMLSDGKFCDFIPKSPYLLPHPTLHCRPIPFSLLPSFINEKLSELVRSPLFPFPTSCSRERKTLKAERGRGGKEVGARRPGLLCGSLSLGLFPHPPQTDSWAEPLSPDLPVSPS